MLLHEPCISHRVIAPVRPMKSTARPWINKVVYACHTPAGPSKLDTPFRRTSTSIPQWTALEVLQNPDYSKGDVVVLCWSCLVERLDSGMMELKLQQLRCRQGQHSLPVHHNLLCEWQDCAGFRLTVVPSSPA